MTRAWSSEAELSGSPWPPDRENGGEPAGGTRTVAHGVDTELRADLLDVLRGDAPGTQQLLALLLVGGEQQGEGVGVGTGHVADHRQVLCQAPPQPGPPVVSGEVVEDDGRPALELSR